MTPAEHYEAADVLLAEVAQADPAAAPRLPFVQFKLQRAQVHALLATCAIPYGHDDGYFDDEYDAETAAQCIAASKRVVTPHSRYL